VFISVGCFAGTSIYSAFSHFIKI